ncbi:MAG: hypothetical protein HOF55_04940 [Candidatus Marinimicrobia bacterium]|jgi:hypothetical protein|nr:hypothetical protein [Candidatus Neomarinimicrobiota bacterium]MBT7899443.1 hypothetical protein [Candidatus Neomarinimicrobiota bacterium]
MKKSTKYEQMFIDNHERIEILQAYPIRYKQFNIVNKASTLRNPTLEGHFMIICRDFLFRGSMLLKKMELNGKWEPARHKVFSDSLKVTITQVSDIMKKLQNQKAIIPFGYSYYVNPLYQIVGTMIPIEELAFFSEQDSNIRKLLTRKHYNNVLFYKNNFWRNKPY